jgi:hypothetical protein
MFRIQNNCRSALLLPAFWRNKLKTRAAPPLLFQKRGAAAAAISRVSIISARIYPYGFV